MTPEEELEPYIELMLDIAQVMIAMKEQLALEKENEQRNIDHTT